jgi:phosphoribosylanthranilate isomerase
MFRIKICGITNVEDAMAVAEAGADAIGLNFYRASPRYVSRDTARQIAAALPAGIVKVGLFVNAAIAEVCEVYDDLRLDLVQLHGDEPPEYVAQLGKRPIMRAFRLGGEGLGPVLAYLDQCRQLAAMPTLVLLDAFTPTTYGGTGQTCDWSLAAQYADRAKKTDMPPLVLAGGLTPLNVAVAIRQVRPAAVDVAGGVESSPGRKDRTAVSRFVQAAKGAW